MQVNELQQKLIAAARAQAPGGHIPYAFEKRIMARIAALPAPDAWALWSSALWRSAAACIALTLIVAALALALPHRQHDAANEGDHTLALTIDTTVEPPNELQ